MIPEIPDRAPGKLPRDARCFALSALRLCFNGMPAQRALSQVLAGSGHPERDNALCTELFYGYLRSRLRIDFIISRFLKNPGKVPPLALSILGLAIYSLLFLEKQPGYAVVDSAVENVRILFGKSLAGLANAVLRNFLRLGKQVHEPEFYKIAADQDELPAMARFYSLPGWLAEFWRRQYPENYLNLMRRSFLRPRRCIRLNRHNADAEMLSRDACPAGLKQVLPFAFICPDGPMPVMVRGQSLGDLHDAGLLSWQAAGSQMIMSELFSETCDGPVWDACAGVGGKSLWLLENGLDACLASDVSRSRLSRIRGECQRLGLVTPGLFVGSPNALASWNGHILLDVPCSGLGVLARRPDILIHAKEGSAILKRHLKTQAALLDRAAWLVPRSSSIIYITCTLNPLENDLQIGNFLARHPAFGVIKIWQSPADHPWLEGMFGAVLRRN